MSEILHACCITSLCVSVPDYGVGTVDELRFRVPLVVGYEVVCLQPDPLLALREKAIVA